MTVTEVWLPELPALSISIGMNAVSSTAPGKQRFKVGDDGRSERCGDHQQHQPRQAVRHQTPDAGFHIIFVARNDSGHLFDVLGVLILNDVHDIVDGDDADQAVFLIADGDGSQVVTAEVVGNGFLDRRSSRR